jgi:hypothetical protein
MIDKKTFIARLQIIIPDISDSEAESIVERITTDLLNRLSGYGNHLTLMSDFHEYEPGEEFDEDDDEDDYINDLDGYDDPEELD